MLYAWWIITFYPSVYWHLQYYLLIFTHTYVHVFYCFNFFYVDFVLFFFFRKVRQLNKLHSNCIQICILYITLIPKRFQHANVYTNEHMLVPVLYIMLFRIQCRDRRNSSISIVQMFWKSKILRQIKHANEEK